MEEKIPNNILDNTHCDNEQMSDPVINHMPNPVAATVPPPKKFDLNRKDIVFSFLLCFASVIFSSFALWGSFGAGFTVSSLITFFVITAYLCNKNTKIRTYPLSCGLLATVAPISFAITSNSSVKFWSFVCILLLSAVWFDSLVNDKSEEGDLGLIQKILASFFKGVLCYPKKTLRSLFTVKKDTKNKFGNVIIGIILALPVLVIVVPLLMSSDAAFSGLIASLVTNLLVSVFKIIVGLIMTPFIISYCFALKEAGKPPIKSSNFKGVENSSVISFLSVLSLCYVAYLFSQLAYFFSAFKGFLPEDYSFTVATYARRGFFEMSIIAAINFVIIFTVLLLSKKNNRKICITSRILCLFISIFTLIIISTALSKMFLYIRSFGMTRLRITTSAFMIFLSVVFLSLILRLFIPRVQVLRAALTTAGCILILLGTLNINSVIASYNYGAYKNGLLESVDIETIYDLGDESVPYLVKLANSENYEIKEEATKKLRYAITSKYYDGKYEDDVYNIQDRTYDDIGGYSISRSAAYKALDEYIAQNPDILWRQTEWFY